MRLCGVIAALFVIATLGVGTVAARPFQPFEGQSIWGGRFNTPKAPWCMNFNSGADRVEVDCSYSSFQACQFALGNPNNGFCTQTYVNAGPPSAPPNKKKRRIHY